MSNVRKLPKDVEKTRTIPFVFSDETRDSFRTVFTAKEWDLDRFNKNGVALYNHNAYSDNPDVIVGSGRAWVEGKQLLGEITFEPAELNPMAEKVFRKYLNGTLKGVSIRFWPQEAGQWGTGEESQTGANPTYYIGRRELIEISCTPIPSNKNALMRSHGTEGAEELQKDEGYYIDGTVRFMDTPEPEVNADTKDNEIYTRTLINAYKALGNIQ